MFYSSNKWKKIQKISQRCLLAVCIFFTISLCSRFSILSLNKTLNFQEKLLLPSYLLVDTKPHKGRNFSAGDIVICNNTLGYIIATSNNIVTNEENSLVVDDVYTLFETHEHFVKLQQHEYLVYHLVARKYNNQKISIVQKKEITSRILMTLLQK